MKELFIIWIIIQLLVIGIGSASMHNQMVDGTYECNNYSEKAPVVFGAMLPLAAFVPNFDNGYCMMEGNK